MKRLILFALLFAALATVAASNSYGQEGTIKIDTIKNTQYANEIQSGLNPRFMIRYTNTTTHYCDLSNGFKVMSPDGAKWDSVTFDSIGPFNIDGECLLLLRFNQVASFDQGNHGGTTSGDADSVGFLGAGSPTSNSRQLTPTYNDTAFALTIWQTPGETNHGLHFCIDSADAGEGLWTWKWVGRNPTPGGSPIDHFPTWEGLTGQTHGANGYCFMVRDPLVGVDDDNGASLPLTWSVSQNYPNPFNPSTTIDYSVPRKSKVTLSVYNVLGQKVATLVNAEMAAGKYRAVWDGKAENGTNLSSGIYFYKFEADKFVKTSKMVMLK